VLFRAAHGQRRPQKCIWITRKVTRYTTILYATCTKVDFRLGIAPDSGAYSIGHAPSFTNGLARGDREYRNSKQDSDQIVLTITKALTTTTYCAFKAKKWMGHDQIHFFRLRTGVPHFQIRSGATGPRPHRGSLRRSDPLTGS